MSAYLATFVISVVIITAISIVYILRKMASDDKIQAAEKKAHHTVEKANKEAHEIVSKAHRESQKTLANSRKEVEEEVRTRRKAVSQIEDRVIQKEKNLDQKEESLSKKEETVHAELERVRQLRQKEEDMINSLSERLEKIAEFSKEEAKNFLMTNVERESRSKAGKMIKEIEEQAKKIANRKAKEIITDAIQRTAVDHVQSLTTSVVQLPDDDMKGRVIGREGRNIRAFEAATGVDIIIDDTPGAVVLSAFDPIRREIAKMSLQTLLRDGRIHPTRVEEAVEKAKKDLQEKILETGEKAAEEVGLQFHPKIIELLGRLQFRTSYGQNILGHSLESAHLAGHMAQRLGVNVSLAKRGALLHDIGKAIDFETGGSHDDIGKEICEKYGESDEVINCIMAHHEDEEPDTIEAILVMMADALSSVRPGARRESLETYVKRLEKLEALANEYEGVEKAYAIQAGREIRVLVRPDDVDDNAATKLAFDMAKKIEQTLDYPGEVRVSVIRETRAVGVAH